MRFWSILTFAFGSLILLIGLLGLGAARQVSLIYREAAELNQRQYRTEQVLSELRANLHLSGVDVRDYLLDRSEIRGEYFRNRLLDTKTAMAEGVEQLETMAGAGGAARLDQLRRDLESYWSSLDPLSAWTPAQKMALSYVFLRRDVLPKRNAVSDMTREIRRLTGQDAREKQQAIELRQRELRREMVRIATIGVALALLIAAASIVRIRRLERTTREQHARTEQAEHELRRLSQQLVTAQEEERRFLSRELHDEVGQKLTALRMDLVALERARGGEEFGERIQETKTLAESTLRAVRDLALGLRPSMLDDLGLGPALQWQARDFSRRFNVPVSVQIEGDLTTLPERHRTCIYRVVQEALTNCARHSHAKEVRVLVHGNGNSVSAVIQDDGVGLPADGRGRGLGLIGIEERVHELGGEVSIAAAPEKGTVLNVFLRVTSETLP